jgi:hypothetical protein
MGLGRNCDVGSGAAACYTAAMSKRTRKLTVMLSDAEHWRLTAEADARGLNLSDVVRQWIRQAPVDAPVIAAMAEKNDAR